MVREKTNPYEARMENRERGEGTTLAFAMVLIACIAAVLLSIAVAGHAIWRILETTPFMGIPVDAQGNRIPVQGYPRLMFLWRLPIFTIVASCFGFLFAVHRQEDRITSYRRRGK